jgi:predicted DNA-binding transcriptional regulator YafY
MPPLMLTPSEATAVALGLLTTRREGLDADAALTKIRRVLPERVRLRLEALEETLRFTEPAPDELHPPKADNLLALAEAALRGRRVDVRYADAAGRASRRELSPWGIVAHAGRWYVPAFDHGRDAPRTLRGDRFATVELSAARGGVPAPAGFDAAAFVARALARVPWTHEVEVVLYAPRDAVVARFPPSLAELDEQSGDTLLRMRAESLDWVAGMLAGAGCAFTIRRPAALRDAVRALAARLHAA